MPKHDDFIEVTDLDLPELAPFARLTEAQLRNRLEPDNGIFIAESPKVIRVALQAGLEATALLCERRHIDGDAADIIAQIRDGGTAAGPDIPMYTGEREVLASLTGYTLTRGVLAAMRRPSPRSVDDVCRTAQRVAVLDGVVDTTNLGAIFRSAAALGVDAVLLTPTCCDPLNRRAVRVAMGTTFLVPWTWVDGAAWQQQLRTLGFRTVAMALRDNAVALDDERLCREPRLAIVMGTEGDGLADAVIDDADYVVRIPMSHGVDSLNVAAASAVAFWQLRKRG